MSKIVIKDLLKKYSGKVALRNFSVEIPDGEFTVLLGEQGAGKSAVLRTVCGLDEIDGGEVYVDGELVNKLEPKDRNMAVVFEKLSLYENLNVYDNMAAGLKMRKASKDEIDRCVYRSAAILGLTDYLQRKPKNITVGQRQRVVLGRAIARSPKLVLLDEPFKALDRELQKELRTETVKLNKRLGINFIFATADYIEALTVADRIIYMENGEIVQIGTSDEIYDRPQSLALAQKIGSPVINMFIGKLVKDGAKVYGEFEGCKVALSDECAKNIPEEFIDSDKNVTFAIRAEDITATTDGEGDCVISAKIDDVDTFGEVSVASCYSASTDRAKRFSAFCDGEVGDEVKLKFDVGHLLVYDTETEKLLG